MAAIRNKQSSVQKWWSDHRLTVKLTVYLVATVLAIGFIFSNSLQNREESADLSGNIAALLKPIIDPADNINDEVFHGLIRKLAHGFEFAVLGLCCGGFMWCFAELSKRYHIASAILLPLVVAVSDEFIQSFNDRGSSVRDVLIDFGGAVFGLLLISAVEALLAYYRKSTN